MKQDIEGQEIKRQAVVVIHGMGEQRPMDTLRSFVSSVKSELERCYPAEKRSTVRSKPDSIGDIYETVRLSMDRTDKRPITDFYEFYWAHNMRDTEFSQMTGWIKRLVFTSVRKVPQRLKILWYTVWALLILAPVAAYLIARSDTSGLKQFLAPLLTAALFPFLLSFVLNFLKSGFLNSAGDAARYFTPAPENVGERSRIRHQGITFLKKLHEISSNEKVDRIILVAHSLGTVVAYDLLRLLWCDFNTTFNEPLANNQQEIIAINKFSDGTIPVTSSTMAAFRDQQHEAWKEQRANGNKWLITDFITVGAALNAIDYFMVANESMDVMKEQRELPICPALKDKKDETIFYEHHYEQQGQKHTVLLLNHAALFGVTRWTNIFFTSDFVGGPMQKNFGTGVVDIPIKRKSMWFLPGGHTKYWDRDYNNEITDSENALHQLTKAMQLNTK